MDPSGKRSTPYERTIVLPGIKRAKKHRQGTLDGLCGLYAAINAINVLLAASDQRRPRAAHAAMRVGLSYLKGHTRLEEAVSEGMGVMVQYRMTLAIAKTFQDKDGLRFKIARPLAGKKRLPRRKLFSCLDECLLTGSAVIVCLGNTHEHYTVIIGVTPTRYLLQDSDGLNWISKRCLGISTGAKAYRHLIYPKSVISLSLTLQ